MDAWKDEQTLVRLYVEEEKTLQECGEILGCHKQTVSNWLERFGIDRRSKTDHIRRKPAYHGWDERGYEVAGVNNNRVRLHRLVAIADGADPRDIFGGANVHHKNGVPWDNRPCNLEVMSHSEHRQEHEGTLNAPWKSEDVLRHHYHNKGMSLREMGDEFGVSPDTVMVWMDKLGIPRRDAWEHNQK